MIMARPRLDVRSGADLAATATRTVEVEEPPLPEVAASVWTKLGEGGRVVIPAEIRQMLGLKTGSQVLLRVEDGELHLLTSRQAVKRAQALARPYIEPGVSVVDELIAERRVEAARE
jgi:AbrB family looped-hinge helix DNA binding protein